MIYSPDLEFENEENNDLALNSIDKIDVPNNNVISINKNKYTNRNGNQNLNVDNNTMQKPHCSDKNYYLLNQIKDKNSNESLIDIETNFEGEVLDTEGHCEISGIANKHEMGLSVSRPNLDINNVNSNLESLYEKKLDGCSDVELGTNNKVNRKEIIKDQAIKSKSYLDLKTQHKNKNYNRIDIEQIYDSNDLLKQEIIKTEDIKIKQNPADNLNTNTNCYLFSKNETNMYLNTQMNKKKKNLIIICCPNGGAFEYSISVKLFFIYVYNIL